jgi:hypothetical protein
MCHCTELIGIRVNSLNHSHGIGLNGHLTHAFVDSSLHPLNAGYDFAL